MQGPVVAPEGCGQLLSLPLFRLLQGSWGRAPGVGREGLSWQSSGAFCAWPRSLLSCTLTFPSEPP